MPADNTYRVAKALGSGADAVIVDLEDAVLPTRKAAARDAMTEVLGRRRQAPEDPIVLVRVNGLDSEHSQADLVAVRALASVRGVVMPKADRETLERLPAEGLPCVIALIETAAGVLDAADIARLRIVGALMLGTVDLSTELAFEVTADGPELIYIRSHLVLAAAAAGLPSPIDGVWPDVDDSEGLRREAAMARRLGFGAKACIHPRQLDVVHRAFAPSERELAWAAKVVAAFETAERAGRGATAVGGQMVDR
ncbi:MAG: CoA ester lyase, partial [Aldersonia sp.]|nr:CoA ester lyase [Aldersonia sp.]